MNESAMPQKEQKHLVINDGFCELENEISRFGDLVYRVEGSEPDKNVNEEIKPMSLLTFLNETPERLAKLTNLLKEQRKKLTEYLF